MTTTAPKRMQAQPLYARVRGDLVERLISGIWKPGQMLPSEFAIAAELGVSQGTVRKALDEMTMEGLLFRRQGKGTFVAEAEDTDILFRFYRLTADEESEARFPHSRYLERTKAAANDEECEVFNITPNSQVWRIVRTRHDENHTLLWERLVLPCELFPNLDDAGDLPNNVYQFYGRQFGIIIARVHEKLRAVSASSDIANHLEVPQSTPLLQIDRRAIALSGRCAEWRVSLCRTDIQHYRNELR